MLSRSLPSNLKTTSMSHAPLARTRVLPLHLLGALAALCALPARGAAGDSCDGGQASFVQNPRTVAVLETRVPEQRRFLLRGTVPLPPGVYPRTDGLNPLTILDYDGTPLLTQIEIVSQYPSPVDGADVVELLAQVRRDPTLSPGEPTQYTVIQRLNESSPSPGLIEPLPRGVLDMLADPTQVELASYDCFGNKYVAYPLMIGSAIRRLRSGPIMAEVRSFQNMLPAEPVPGSTLPHFLGVHTYRSVIRGSSHIGLDLPRCECQRGCSSGSLLETHPRRATPKARVGTLAVIEAHVRPQCGGPLGRADVGRPIRPFSEQRLNEALGLAIRLGMVGPGESVTNRPGATGVGKDTCAIGEAVVAQESPDPDPTAPVPAHGPSEEGGTRRRILGGEHLDVRHAGGVIDGNMEKFPADAPCAAATVAMNTMADALNAAEALHIHVEEIAGVRPLIATDGRGRLARRHAIEAPARQDPRDR